MTGPNKSRWRENLLTLPSLVWLVVLFLIPTLVIFAFIFKPADPYGGIGAGWTLNNILDFEKINYPDVYWRTLWISMTATVICLLLAVPMAYYMATVSRKHRQTLMLLVIIPFWTNFLVRIFAWKMLLHPEGIIKKVLVFLHMVHADASLLYNSGAVILVMVYTYLPFAILPIYAAAEKFDFTLLDAARDLGAARHTAFRKVFLPGIRTGLMTAFLMVFIPALGAYVIPDIVGGPTSEMLGNKIAQRTFVDRNLPHASWLSAILTCAILLPLLTGFFLRGRKARDLPMEVR